MARGLILLAPIIGSIFFHYYDRREDQRRPERYTRAGERAKIRDIYTHQPVFYYELAARECLKLKQRDKAIEFYKTAAQLASQRRAETIAAGYYEKAGDLLFLENRFQEASKEFSSIDSSVADETAKPIFMKAGNSYAYAAREYLSSMDWKNAVKMHDDAAFSYRRAGDLKKEEDQYRQIVNIHVERGNTFLSQEEFLAAIHAFGQALSFFILQQLNDKNFEGEIKTRCVSLHQKIAETFAENEEWCSAASSYESAAHFSIEQNKKVEFELKACEAYEKQALSYLETAKSLEQTGQLVEARTLYISASDAFFLSKKYDLSGKAKNDANRMTHLIEEAERKFEKRRQEEYERKMQAAEAARKAEAAKKIQAIDTIKALINKPDKIKLVNLMNDCSDEILKELIDVVNNTSVNFTRADKLKYHLNTHPDKIVPQLSGNKSSKIQTELLTALANLAARS